MIEETSQGRKKRITQDFYTICKRSYAKKQSLFLSYIYLGYFVCVCVCVCVTICVGTLCYSFSFSNQTDQGNETEGLEREG